MQKFAASVSRRFLRNVRKRHNASIDFFYRAFGEMTLILRGVGTKLKRSAPSEQARGQSVYADTRKRKDEAEGI